MHGRASLSMVQQSRLRSVATVEVELVVRQKPNVNGQRDDGKGPECVTDEGDQSELLKNGNRMAHASIAGPRMMIRARESG
jgi:hypothetical protein